MRSQLNLFETKSNLRIFRIKPSDVTMESDRFKIFQRLISENETMYPDIQRWLKTKVLQGIKTGERISYVGFVNEKPIVTSIVKKGK